MDPFELSILFAAALATSALSAVVGMAGGITLLSVMLLFLEPLLAVPLHGVVQLVSNSSRAVIQRKHVRWELLGRYAILLLPMGFAGLAVAKSLPPAGARVTIGAFVLVATWAPHWLLLGRHPERTDPGHRFLLLGGVVGFLSPTIGATGPLIAPFFLNIGLTRHALIGSKAAIQTLGHLAKLVVFGFAGFAFHHFAGPLALLCAAVILGTWIGSRLLERVDEVWFTRLYKGVLTVIAVRLVVWDGLSALGVL
ncbi:MAG: sulfite exporter TauE/SafE family protein [Myxococcota bacterium]